MTIHCLCVRSRRTVARSAECLFGCSCPTETMSVKLFVWPLSKGSVRVRQMSVCTLLTVNDRASKLSACTLSKDSVMTTPVWALWVDRENSLHGHLRRTVPISASCLCERFLASNNHVNKLRTMVRKKKGQRVRVVLCLNALTGQWPCQQDVGLGVRFVSWHGHCPSSALKQTSY